MNVHTYLMYKEEYDKEYLRSAHRDIDLRNYERSKRREKYRQILGVFIFCGSIFFISWLLSR